MVQKGDKILPRCLFEVEGPPGSCMACGGSGEVIDTIDDDRLPEVFPCHLCRKYCKECKRHVPKTHEHPTTPA